MTEEKPDSPEFRVVDKRRFTNEGETKASSPDDERERTAPAALPKTENTPREQRPHEDHAPTVDFPSFVVSLATQALIMLGEIPNPETQSAVENLEAAKQTIDILAMLEEKTRGNLSAEEQRLISEVLTSLRLTFVKKLEKKK